MNSPPSMLQDISTRWPLITDPVQFVLRYAPAIQAYLGAIIRNPEERDEVSQEFFLQVLQRGFVPEQVTRGRFRDYLKAAVRNAALGRLARLARQDARNVPLPADPAAEPEEGEKEWLAQWRQSLLEQALAALEEHERRSPGGRLHAVLQAALEKPDADSRELAQLVSRRTGQAMTPEAFRKQLSRARVQFAGFLVIEVRKTLTGPTPEDVTEELGDLGLLAHVRPYLPEEKQ